MRSKLRESELEALNLKRTKLYGDRDYSRPNSDIEELIKSRIQ